MVEAHFFPHGYGNHVFPYGCFSMLKVLSIPIELHFHYCEKSVDLICVAVFLCLFCFIDLYLYLFICQSDSLSSNFVLF